MVEKNCLVNGDSFRGEANLLHFDEKLQSQTIIFIGLMHTNESFTIRPTVIRVQCRFFDVENMK